MSDIDYQARLLSAQERGKQYRDMIDALTAERNEARRELGELQGKFRALRHDWAFSRMNLEPGTVTQEAALVSAQERNAEYRRMVDALTAEVAVLREALALALEMIRDGEVEGRIWDVEIEKLRALRDGGAR